MTCDSAVKDRQVHKVSNVLDQQLTRPEGELQEEEEWEEEEVADGKVTFLDAEQGLEMARKYIWLFDIAAIIIIRYEVLTALHMQWRLVRKDVIGD
jgi:hypothetical protein